MKEAQCIICNCGSVIAAGVAPLCYTSKEWMKDVRDYANKGYKIEMREVKSFTLNKCLCVSMNIQQPESTQPFRPSSLLLNYQGDETQMEG